MSEPPKSAPPEILFAQHLASNEKVHRDRALRKLRKYLFNHSSLPDGGFNETELLKIWKGLHYCMWMQDKPLIQEELSDSISQLVHSFNNANTALLFLTTFYKTECREWTSIDKWRMDKFLMFFRNMLTQSFEFLKKKNWSEKLTRRFLGFLSSYILNDHSHDTSPDGVRYHLADIFLTELQNVSAGQLGPKQTLVFIEPWISMLIRIKCRTLRAFVIKNIFGQLIQTSPVIQRQPRKKGANELRVNYRLLADKLMEAGASEECTSMNRPPLYNLVQNFRNIADGKPPCDVQKGSEEEVRDLDEDDIEEAVQRLAEFRENIFQENCVEKRKVKKRKRAAVEEDEAYGSDTSTDGLDNSMPAKLSPPSIEEVIPPKKTGKELKKGVLSKKLKKSLQLQEEFMQDESGDEDAEEAIDDEPLADPEHSELRLEIGEEQLDAEVNAKKKKKRSKKRAKAKLANGSPLETEVEDKSEQQLEPPSVSQEFDVAEFPEADDISTLIPAEEVPAAEPARVNLSKRKKKMKRNTNNNNVSVSANGDTSPTLSPGLKSLKKSKGLAEFVAEPGAKAKFFKKSTGKAASPGISDDNATSVQTPVTRSQSKRLSFGKNSSVKKSAVKLRGSMSYDPTKTPEQGILKVNPIQPGTVIQVGKKATIKNTLKNSKFPHGMMAMEFF